MSNITKVHVCHVCHKYYITKVQITLTIFVKYHVEYHHNSIPLASFIPCQSQNSAKYYYYHQNSKIYPNLSLKSRKFATKFTNNRKTQWRIGIFELKLKIGSRRGQIGPHQPIEANGTKAKWGEMGSNGAKWGKRCKLVPNGAKRGQNVSQLRPSDKNQLSYEDFVIFWNIIGPH